jgi:phosphatidate phosphatase APP1
MRTMVAQFASREEAGVHVTLEIDAGGTPVRHHAVSDREGYVRFDVALDPPFDLPVQPVWETVALHWSNRAGPQCVEGHVLAPGSENRLAVMSDIDDTIIETGITGGMRAIVRNWRRILAELPEDRIAVPGADVFYGALGGGQALPPGERRPEKRVAATHRPFFYVSSSPWNLFSYLVAFQQAKGLPLGPLMLRDWGFDRATFGSGSHGQHKADAISAILAMYPELRFALIGDDTQGDLPAYAQAAIGRAGVPLWLGDGYAVAQDFLNAVGFTPGGETEQIVRAVEKVPTAAESHPAA